MGNLTKHKYQKCIQAKTMKKYNEFYFSYYNLYNINKI